MTLSFNILLFVSSVFCMIYYKHNYQHKIGYIQWEFPDTDKPIRWWEDYYSRPFVIIRGIVSLLLIIALIYVLVTKFMRKE